MNKKTKRGLFRAAQSLIQKANAISVYAPSTDLAHLNPCMRFSLSQPSIGTLIKISSELLRFPEAGGEEPGADELQAFAEAMYCQANRCARIAAYALKNSEKDPSPRLVKKLSRELTPGDLFMIAKLTVRGMDISFFHDFFRLDKKRSQSEEEEDSPGVNTVWGLIGMICKYWKWSERSVKWEMSYQNAMMYLKTIPVYRSKAVAGKEKQSDQPEEVNSMDDFLKLGIE